MDGCRINGRVGGRQGCRVCRPGGRPLLLRDPLGNTVIDLEGSLDEGFQVSWFARATKVILDVLLESSIKEPSHGVFTPIEGHLQLAKLGEVVGYRGGLG